MKTCHFTQLHDLIWVCVFILFGVYLQQLMFSLMFFVIYWMTSVSWIKKKNLKQEVLKEEELLLHMCSRCAAVFCKTRPPPPSCKHAAVWTAAACLQMNHRRNVKPGTFCRPQPIRNELRSALIWSWDPNIRKTLNLQLGSLQLHDSCADMTEGRVPEFLCQRTVGVLVGVLVGVFTADLDMFPCVYNGYMFWSCVNRSSCRKTPPANIPDTSAAEIPELRRPRRVTTQHNNSQQ